MHASVTCPFCQNKIGVEVANDTFAEIMNDLRHGLLNHLNPKFDECPGLPESSMLQPVKPMREYWKDGKLHYGHPPS